jgi:hypothetical protein
MPITPTIADGFYVYHTREGCKMSRRCLSRRHAEECLRNMMEDTVVDLPRVRYYFQGHQILILRKPNLTDPRWKCPMEGY